MIFDPWPLQLAPGRWGSAEGRLMPFLVAAAEAPSYASVALVKPESTGSYRWTKKAPWMLVRGMDGVGMLVDDWFMMVHDDCWER